MRTIWSRERGGSRRRPSAGASTSRRTFLLIVVRRERRSARSRPAMSEPFFGDVSCPRARLARRRRLPISARSCAFSSSRDSSGVRLPRPCRRPSAGVTAPFRTGSPRRNSAICCTAAIDGRGAGNAMWPSSCCSPVWVCGPARSLALTLDDIDWRGGELVVHGKGKTRAPLPLPSDVGRALSAYVLHRPPQRDETRLPPRTRAASAAARGRGDRTRGRETGGPLSRPSRLIVCAARPRPKCSARGPPSRRSPRVLRHTSTQTTAIYATVDRRSLRPLVQPWPGARG